MSRANLLALAATLTDAQLNKALGCLGWRRVTDYHVPWRTYRNYYIVPAEGDPDWDTMPPGLAEKEPGNPRAWGLTALGMDVVRVAKVARDCVGRGDS